MCHERLDLGFRDTACPVDAGTKTADFMERGPLRSLQLLESLRLVARLGKCLAQILGIDERPVRFAFGPLAPLPAGRSVYEIGRENRIKHRSTADLFQLRCYGDLD